MQGLGLGAVDGLRAECGQFGEGFAQGCDIAILAALGNVQQGAEQTDVSTALAQGAQSGGEFGRRSGVPKRGGSRQGGCGGWRVFVVT